VPLTDGPVPNRDRDQFGPLMDSRGLSGVGLEIGVADADFSVQMLNNWKGLTKYHLVDPWMHQDDSIYKKDGNNWQQEEQDLRYKGVENRMQEFTASGKVEIHRMLSSEAASLIEDNSLTFLYIDGNHGYDAVKEDLEVWYPKLKRGGLCAGHDYSEGHFGVMQASHEFAYELGLDLHITDVMKERLYVTEKFMLPPCCPSFYFFKP